MKRYSVIMVALAGFLVSPLFTRAQAPAPAAAPAAAASTADGIRAFYNGVKNNLLKAADKMPDDAYDFKPTPEQRSFGGWIAHVADAQTNGCARVLGVPPATQEVFSKQTKAQLASYLKSSFDTCDQAYAGLTDANAGDMVQSFRGPMTRAASLVGNVAHDNECYGTIAVYLRLKGIVPPSSEPRK
jgi:uncharacterized damage-inducible protein DinB